MHIEGLPNAQNSLQACLLVPDSRLRTRYQISQPAQLPASCRCHFIGGANLSNPGTPCTQYGYLMSRNRLTRSSAMLQDPSQEYRLPEGGLAELSIRRAAPLPLLMQHRYNRERGLRSIHFARRHVAGTPFFVKQQISPGARCRRSKEDVG